MLFYVLLAHLALISASALPTTERNSTHASAPSDVSGTVTLLSTHPSIVYSPQSDCPSVSRGQCNSRRFYVWQNYDYWDSRGAFRSFAVADNKFNGWEVNSPHTIEIPLPRARAMQVYGAPRRLLWGHRAASQRLCFGRLACFNIDAQKIYQQAPSDDELVLLWAGDVFDPGNDHLVTITMAEKHDTHARDENLKVMTLAQVVFSGVDVDERRTYPSPSNDVLVHYQIRGDDLRRLSLAPRGRWDQRSSGVSQASTTFNDADSKPSMSFKFSGTAVQVWSAPRSELTFSAGGVRACLDDECDLIDVYQMYLTAASEFRLDSSSLAADRPVLIWSRDHLDASRDYTVSVELHDANAGLGREAGDIRKGITIHHVEYIGLKEPSPPTPPPRLPPSIPRTTAPPRSTRLPPSTPPVTPRVPAPPPYTPPIASPSPSPPDTIILLLSFGGFLIVLAVKCIFHIHVSRSKFTLPPPSVSQYGSVNQASGSSNSRYSPSVPPPYSP